MNEPLKIKVKKLHPKAVIPSYSKHGDAGLDLTAVFVEELTKELDEYTAKVTQFKYRTGLAFEIPEGYVGLLFPRSSVFKKDLSLSNSVGVLDSGFRGEVCFIYNLTDRSNVRTFEAGDRIGQLVIMPYPQIQLIESDELSDSERGQGCYGSTGK